MGELAAALAAAVTAVERAGEAGFGKVALSVAALEDAGSGLAVLAVLAVAAHRAAAIEATFLAIAVWDADTLAKHTCRKGRGAEPAVSATAISLTFFAIALGLAFALAIDASGLGGRALPAGATTAVGTALFVVAVGNALALACAADVLQVRAGAAGLTAAVVAAFPVLAVGVAALAFVTPGTLKAACSVTFQMGTLAHSALAHAIGTWSIIITGRKVTLPSLGNTRIFATLIIIIAYHREPGAALPLRSPPFGRCITVDSGPKAGTEVAMCKVFGDVACFVPVASGAISTTLALGKGPGSTEPSHAG